jgi:hypothetical protein
MQRASFEIVADGERTDRVKQLRNGDIAPELLLEGARHEFAMC